MLILRPLKVDDEAAAAQAHAELDGDLVGVEMQDRQSGKMSRGGDQQVRHRWGAVMASVGEQGLDLDSAILDRRGQVLDRHGRQWRGA